MKIVIFTYNREEMLNSLLQELQAYPVTIIDDGSEWTKEGGAIVCQDSQLLRTNHEGKKGFWKKWLIAHQLCLGSNEDWFLFLPDDFQRIDMEQIEKFTKMGWEEELFALNISNSGRNQCWGLFSTGAKDFYQDEYKFTEYGFTDCSFLTNRHTLEKITIDPVGGNWFKDSGRSSGVGHQTTMKFRELGVKMLHSIPSLAYHGAHDSVMHYEHRKETPRTSIMYSEEHSDPPIYTDE